MAEYSTSIDIHASPDEVFEYLVTAKGLTAWMGQYATLEAHEGGAFEVDIAGSPIRGEYLEIIRPHRVVVSWGVAGSADLPPGTSRVAFLLAPTATGTRVELVHSDLPEARVAGHVEGWAHFLPRLATVAGGAVLGSDDWVPVPLR
jgi:uncharacterized protein YndB with AHSA1/START domain